MQCCSALLRDQCIFRAAISGKANEGLFPLSAVAAVRPLMHANGGASAQTD